MIREKRPASLKILKYGICNYLTELNMDTRWLCFPQEKHFSILFKQEKTLKDIRVNHVDCLQILWVVVLCVHYVLGCSPVILQLSKLLSNPFSVPASLLYCGEYQARPQGTQQRQHASSSKGTHGLSHSHARSDLQHIGKSWQRWFLCVTDSCDTWPWSHLKCIAANVDPSPWKSVRMQQCPQSWIRFRWQQYPSED